MATRRRLVWAMVMIFAAVAAYLALSSENPPPSEDAALREGASGATEIARLFRERRSGVVVEGAGTVEKMLSDDLEGSRHQRFILRLVSERTILVSHNIDLAPRIDSLRIGDEVRFRGQYEWNERGGLLHWTHHDPAGRRPGGWIRHAHQTYR